MKKLAIAGASLALAAMPMVGVFAETTVKDSLTVTVSSSCELANITPSGVSESTPNNYYGSGNPGQLVSLAAGTKVSPSSGTPTTITVHCNDADGYTITPVFTALMLNGATSAQDIPYSATAATAGSKTWTAYSDGNTKSVVVPTAGITGSSTMTDSYTFAYEVGLGADQAAGDYIGSATYTLSGNPSN